MRWRSVWLAASSALLVAGCGSGSSARTTKPPPRIPAGVVRQLAADADAVASLKGCTARNAAVKFRTEVIATVDQIPQRYREQLLSAANDVASRIPECVPPPEEHGKGKGKGHTKKHGKDDDDG
jgi:hypothetical protein